MFSPIGKERGSPNLRNFSLFSTQINEAGQAVPPFPRGFNTIVLSVPDFAVNNSAGESATTWPRTTAASAGTAMRIAGGNRTILEWIRGGSVGDSGGGEIDGWWRVEIRVRSDPTEERDDSSIAGQVFLTRPVRCLNPRSPNRGGNAASVH